MHIFGWAVERDARSLRVSNLPNSRNIFKASSKFLTLNTLFILFIAQSLDYAYGMLYIMFAWLTGSLVAAAQRQPLGPPHRNEQMTLCCMIFVINNFMEHTFFCIQIVNCLVIETFSHTLLFFVLLNGILKLNYSCDNFELRALLLPKKFTSILVVLVRHE